MRHRLSLFLINVFVMISLLFGQDMPVVSSMKDLHGQKIPKSLLNEISVYIVNIPLRVALADISEKGDVKLNYTHENLPLNQKVSVKKEGVFVVEVLLDVLDQTSTALRISKNGSLFIVPNDKQDNKKEDNGQISGYVQDIKTGEALPGANVWLDGTTMGSATNDKGEFVILNVPPGSYHIKANYIGYKDFVDTVAVKSAGKVFRVIDMKYSGAGESEVIVVQAQASGQMQAINQQLSAAELKNVVSKDRIQQLPSQNAAESVGRLPGVSLLRAGGEGNQVVIRGLEPKYNKIMIDGVSMAPTSSNDRSVSMGMISSYSLEGIEVIKSPTANMDGDQVGGSVNFTMKTAPKGFSYEVIAQGGYNELRNSFNDYMFVGNISNRFYDNKFGIFAQFIADGKNMGSNSMSAGYKRLDNKTDRLNPQELTGVTLTNSFRYRKRYGGTLTLDFKIPDGKIYFKNFISNANTLYNTYDEYFGKSEHRFTPKDRSSKQLIYTNVLNYNQSFSSFMIDAKVAHTFSGTEVPRDIEFKFNDTHDMNSFDSVKTTILPEEVPDYAKNMYDNFIWASFEDAENTTDGRQIMAQLDFTTDFRITRQISGKFKFGGKYRYDERSYDQDGFKGNPTVASNIDYKQAIIDQIPQMSGLSANGSFYYPYFYDHDFSAGEFLKGRFTPGPVADIDLLHDILDVMKDHYDEVSHEGITNIYYHMAKYSVFYDYTGFERLGAGYMMFDLNLTKKIRFIPGVRYEAKTTTYHGVYGNSGKNPEYVYTPYDTTSERNNDFWLPMIHLRYDPFDWMQIRLAYTHTIARPNFRYILPNMDYGQNGITMQNPYLKPELSENFDLYFAFSENYIGLFTIGGFWKNIQDKIFSQGERVLLDPEEYGISPAFEGERFTIQENNPNISIVKGFEIDWQTNFWYLPSVLKGLVLNVNYTKIYSEAKYPRFEVETSFDPSNPFVPIFNNIDKSYWDRMQNQPDHIINIAFGYDIKGFSGRVSMNYTSNIFVTSSFWPEERRITDDYLRWDLQLSQKLPWEALQVYLNATNLSGEVESSHLLGWSKQRSMNYYGRAIYAGLRWKIN
jgi:TonB-dependent receptor